MYSVGEVLLHLLNTISSIWLTSIAFTQKTPTAEALSVLLQFDHLSSSSDDITLQLMEKRTENAFASSVTGLACEQALNWREYGKK